MALPSLVVRMGLDAAEFFSGLTKAEGAAKAFAGNISQIDKANKEALASANALGRSMGLAFAGAITAAGAAVVAVDQLIKSVAKFKDLEEKTGASAEALASFAVSAAVGGAAMADIANFSIKLTKNLTGVSDETKAAGAALKALGIPIKEFKALDPAAQMERLAKALAAFEDGKGKSAVLEALARGASHLLPFLKELGAEGGRQTILTQQQIELASEYANKQARLVAEIKLYAQAAATEALPAVNALTKATRDFIGELIGVDSVSKELRNENAIATFAENSATAIAFLADAIDAVAIRLPNLIKNSVATIEKAGSELLTGKLKQAADTYAKGVAAANETLERTTIRGALDNVLALQKATREAQAFNPPEPPGLKRIPGQGGRPSLDDFAGKAAKARSGASRAAISEAQRYLENLQKQLQKTDELSAAETVLADIRAGRLKLSNGITQERLVGIAQQIDQAKALKKSLEEEAKAREVNSRATIKAHEAAIQDVERMAEQNAALRDEIALIDADVAARKAIEQARISSAIALKQDTVAMLENAGASPAVIAALEQQINLLRERGALLSQRSAIDQGIEDATKAQRAYALTLDRVGLAQRRIDIAADSGAITSLEALRQRSAATKSYIGSLQKQLVAVEALARLEINPIKQEDALHRVEQMRVELEALAAQGDLVAKKFNDIFAGSFANSLSDFIDGTKSAKDAFKDFTKSVTQQINQIASQDIAQRLFGKDGLGEGIGGIFSSLFGGGKAATKVSDPAAAAATALAATTTASTTAIASLGAATSATVLTLPALDLGLVSLAAAAQAAAAALLTVSSSKGAGALGDLFGSFAGGSSASYGGEFGRFAHGGNPPVGRLSLVGERGPELFMPKVAGTIVPNNALKSKSGNTVSIVNHINVLPGASRASADQAAYAVGTQVRRAMTRLG